MRFLQLVIQDGFDINNAIRVLDIAKEMDGADNATRRDLRHEMQVVYKGKFKALKQSKGIK